MNGTRTTGQILLCEPCHVNLIGARTHEVAFWYRFDYRRKLQMPTASHSLFTWSTKGLGGLFIVVGERQKYQKKAPGMRRQETNHSSLRAPYFGYPLARWIDGRMPSTARSFRAPVRVFGTLNAGIALREPTWKYSRRFRIPSLAL